MTIVVGADGSVASRAALRWAIDRARSTGDDLALVTVADDGWGSVGDSALEELTRTAEARAERERAFANDLGGGIGVRGVVAVGSPMLALADAARDAGLVAVGTHKVGYFHGHALGARSLQLASVSGVPSAVVPVTSWRGRSGVAVGVADGPDSDDAVRFAAREAIRLGEPLVLLRAGDIDGRQSGITDRAIAIVAAMHPGLTIETRSTVDPASGALIGISRRAVLTVTGRPVPIRGFLPLGRTNTDLLMNLAGAVVVVPNSSVASVVGWTAA